MNKLLAFMHRRIPYLPELKPHCGSLEATILMQQFEHWFAKYPEGFYKFLKPCEHNQYKPGDSWVEELQFSEHEFRTAFDKIGMRYKSKTQFQQKLQAGEDVFDGKYYASYIDVRNNITYYFRNHVLMDQLLDQLLCQFGPTNPSQGSATLGSGNADPALPEPQNSHVQKCGKLVFGDQPSATPEMKKVPIEKFNISISRSKKSLSPNKDPNKNNRNEQQREAAEKSHPQKSTATDALIDQNLSSYQQDAIEQAVDTLMQHLPGLNKTALIEEVSFVVLSEQHFKNSGRDFHKKLNTIKKYILSGRWVTPAELVAQTVVSQKAECDREDELRRELISERMHWQRIQSYLQDPSDEQMQLVNQAITRCHQKLGQLSQVNAE